MRGIRIIVLANTDDPRWQEVSDHCMQALAPGMVYHARLDTIIVIKSQLESTSPDAVPRIDVFS